MKTTSLLLPIAASVLLIACSSKHTTPTASDIESAEEEGSAASISNVNIHQCDPQNKTITWRDKQVVLWQCRYSETIKGDRGEGNFESFGLIGRDEDGKWHYINRLD
jgi:outer membrane biogenesis lipoprotein LolB